MVAEKYFAWLHDLSDEQRVEQLAEKARWADQASSETMITNLMSIFNTADTNRDGVLDRTEIENFWITYGENTIARGA